MVLFYFQREVSYIVVSTYDCAPAMPLGPGLVFEALILDKKRLDNVQFITVSPFTLYPSLHVSAMWIR